MREVNKSIDLSNLPRRGNTSQISWKNSVGFEISFSYDNIKGRLKVIDYKAGKMPKVKIIYENTIREIAVGELLNGKIGAIINRITSDYKVPIGTIYKDDSRHIVITDSFQKMRGSGKPEKAYKYNCFICGGQELIATETQVLNKVRCSGCDGKTVVEGFNDIPTTEPWMIPYFQGGYSEAKLYTRGSNKKVFYICPDCGKVKTKPISVSNLFNYKSIGCSCGDGFSYPEKFMASSLEQLNVDYIWSYSPEWLRGYKGSNSLSKFDFYLPKYSLIIEMDGRYGHGKYVHPNSKISLKDTVDKDNWKDAQAKLHNLKVIRIDSDRSELEYIKNHIIDALGNILDLGVVDWAMCDMNALKNIIKEVSNYYNNNYPISTIEIGDVFGINCNTIRKYLIKATTHGWCEYSLVDAVKRRKEKAINNSIKTTSKKIAVYKDNKCLGTYISIKDLERKSLKNFGTKFYNGYISKVAQGKMNDYKGFTFRYVA